ncbi:MAG: hypothetical protein N3A65_10090, partial [candidate division WOR-3 bacterium]|nr:hypothetical protein [candidate division WOR-3 bacterium]
MKKNLYLKGKKLFALAGLVIFVCTLTDQNNILYGWNEFLIDKSFVYIPAAGNQLFPSIVFANSCYFIVWEDWRNGISDIYGARIS